MLPELADANMDIKVHHVFGSAMLSLTCTTAELSDDDMGGNRDRDRDRADGRSMLSPSDAVKWGWGWGQGRWQVDTVAIRYYGLPSFWHSPSFQQSHSSQIVTNRHTLSWVPGFKLQW